MGFTPKQLRIILTVFFILFSTFFLINQINFFYHLEESVSTSSSAFFKFNRRPVSSSSSVKTIDSSNSLPNDAPAKQYEKDTTVDSFLDLHTLTIAQKHILNPRIAIIITVDNDDSSKVPYVELIDQSIYSIFDTIPEKDFNRTLSISIVYGFAMEERRKTQEMQVLERFMAKTKFPIDVTIPDPMGRGVNAHIKDTAQRIKQSIEDLERRGMKSHYEDITLMFIKAGAEIVTHGWLDIVTDTLMGLATKDANGHNDIVKPANAISFQVEGSSSNQVYSINTDSLDVKTTEISESKLQSSLSLSQNNNKSYPTSIIEGTITAMKLDTYLMLPIVNNNLGNLFVIDLEMSFNLWMCGDGIDIIPQLVARKHSKSSTSSLKGVLNESMKQLMLTWMYDHGNTQYCRDFNWFLDHINGGSKDELEHKFNDVRNKHEVLSVLSKRFDDHHDKVLINAAKKTMTNVIAISTKFDPSKRPRNMTEAELMHFFNKIPKTTKRMKKLFTIGIPHAPAIASDGTDNYIHNVTSLRSNPPELKFDNLNHVCGLHDETWKLLTKKVSVDMSGHIEAERKAKEEGIPRVKLMCIVYTIEPDHYKIPSIRETWGNKCDGFIVASNKTDPLLDTVQIQHSLDEAYNHIYQKVQAIWSYVYDHYYNDFDWFHIGGDGKNCSKIIYLMLRKKIKTHSTQSKFIQNFKTCTYWLKI